MPLLNMVMHPVGTVEQAAEGFKLLATHPIATTREAGTKAFHEVKDTFQRALSGDPRAFGQIVGTAAAFAYGAKNIEPRAPYPNTGGGGLNIMNTPTKGSRIGFDIHRIPEARNRIRPHIDATIKRQGVPFRPKVAGPGSNVVNVKHWPWK